MTQAGSKVSPIPTASDAEFVNRIFAQLQAIFPAWRSAFPDERAAIEAKRQWTQGLVEAGLTDVETIRGGLRMARQADSPFIPSVGQFIGWCREAKKEILGLPSEGQVMRDLARYSHERKYNVTDPRFATQLHPMTYWIYQNLDVHLWREAKEEKAAKILHEIYVQAVARATTGMEFPEPPMLLTEAAPSDAPLTQEQRVKAANALASLKNLWGAA